MNAEQSDQTSPHRLKILTWHIHGSYLYYLTQVPHDFYLPVQPGGKDGYQGKGTGFPWGGNVFDLPLEEVSDLDLDCVIYQSRQNYEDAQQGQLGPRLRDLPQVYLEHDPPREHPTDTRHFLDDPAVLLVHVTHFNQLMWDSGRTPTVVIDHGVVVPEDVQYSGELDRGIVVVNNIFKRGRRLGLDIFEKARAEVPLDLYGINYQQAGGVASLRLTELHQTEVRYRFFFNPIRYTSLGLAVCEAMMLGMPIVGLATTEMVTAVQNGVNGFVYTDLNRVIESMRRLLDDPGLAMELSAGARRIARERFNIQRFVRDWNTVLSRVTEQSPAAAAG